MHAIVEGELTCWAASREGAAKHLASVGRTRCHRRDCHRLCGVRADKPTAKHPKGCANRRADHRRAKPDASPGGSSRGRSENCNQRKLDGDPDLKNLTVVEVRLVDKADNQYKGIATVKGADDTKHDVPVDVTADDENVLWECPPGS